MTYFISIVYGIGFILFKAAIRYMHDLSHLEAFHAAVYAAQAFKI